MRGAGTRHNTLIRLVLSRCEVDLEDIELAYYDRFSNTLQARIAVSCINSLTKGHVASGQNNYKIVRSHLRNHARIRLQTECSPNVL